MIIQEVRVILDDEEIARMENLQLETVIRVTAKTLEMVCGLGMHRIELIVHSGFNSQQHSTIPILPLSIDPE